MRSVKIPCTGLFTKRYLIPSELQGCILLCSARQYLLTCKVSTYCLLVLHGRKPISNYVKRQTNTFISFPSGTISLKNTYMPGVVNC